MLLSEIINEADILVPNSYSSADKVSWLNAINQDFFSVVKIPKAVSFTVTANQGVYTIANDARSKNIDKVQVGVQKYRSLLSEDVQPGQNYWTLDDTTGKITLYPAPIQNGNAVIRYYRIAITTFTSGSLNVQPDAPTEYHWIYTVGLCAKIAKAQDDIAKANNYSAEFTNALSVAAQNYQKIGD